MTDTDRPAFASAMAQLAIGLREKEPDAPQMRLYFAALKDLDVEFVVGAVERLMQAAQWFPKTSEWRAAAVALEQDRRQQLAQVIQRRRMAGAAPLCTDCDDTGFMPSGTRYTRCACRDLRRLEVLGRRPMPLLPEAREGDATQLARVETLAASVVKEMP